MSLRLEWNNDQDEVALPEGIGSLLEKLLVFAGESEQVESGEVALTFVTDEEIRSLNLQYRNMDKATDVLSFSMWEGSEDELDIVYEEESREEHEELPVEPIGDIVISLPTAKRQSEEYGHSLEREIGFLFVHGFLHLIGYDHEDEASEGVMTEKQEQILGRAGLSR